MANKSSLSSFSDTGITLWFEWAPEPIVMAEQAEEVAVNLNNMRSALLASRAIAIADTEKHFDTQTGPDGEVWAPWSWTYAPYAEATNLGGILEQTLEMKGAVTSPTAWGITEHTLFFEGGAAPTRWIWHQEGASRSHSSHAQLEAAGFQATGNVLPARPFIGLDEEAQFEVLDAFDIWLTSTLSLFISGSGALQTRSPSGKFGPVV